MRFAALCRGVLAVTAAVQIGPIARSQCLPTQKCYVGAWAGPWEWNADVCSSYSCTDEGLPVEFLHGAVIPTGRYKGRVLLLRADTGPNCTGLTALETWMFDPAYPTRLTRIFHDSVPYNMECGGQSCDRLGRLVLAGGFPGPLPTNLNDAAFRFDPRAPGAATYPEVATGGVPTPCDPPTIAGGNCWSQIGDLHLPHYYPTLIPLIRWAVLGAQLGSIVGANAIIGGPPGAEHSIGARGNEVWQLLDPSNANSTGQWSDPIVPENYGNSRNGDDTIPQPPNTWPVIGTDYEEYQLERDTSDPNSEYPSPLLDSYPRSFQLSEPTHGQVFIAGDTRTIINGKPFDAAYDLDPTHPLDIPVGTETLTMNVPYAGGHSLPWALLRSTSFGTEHHYGNAALLFRKDSAGTLVRNRVLVFGGEWNLPNVPSYASHVVEEFAPGNDAASSSHVWHQKTHLGGTVSPVPRLYSNSIVLPDGNILVVGGNSAVWDPCLPGSPVSTPELYDPGDDAIASGSTRLLAASNPVTSTSNPNTWPYFSGPPGSIPRFYHSMAMLLPDASVFVVGGVVHGNGGPTNTNCPTPIFPDSRLSGEIFYPPYLYEGDQFVVGRPSIDGVSLSNTSYQQLSTSSQTISFAVDVTTYSGPVAKVSIQRPACPTHHFDSDQRYIELNYSGGGGTGTQQTLSVDAPADDIAPQGYYMLFVLEQRASGQFVPSIAEFIRFM